jgi:hypothetical protein
MHTLQIFKRKFQIPSKWNELSKEQLLKIAHLYTKNLSKEAFDILLISYFTGIKLQNLKNISYALPDMAAMFSFLHNRITITKNLLPELVIKKKTFYGPEDGLLNLSFEQFIIYSENAFQEFAKNQNEEVLDYLVATLYTLKKNVFNENHVAAVSKTMVRIPYYQKYAIFLFYCGSRNYLIDRYKNIFAGESKSSNKNADPLAFIKLLDQLNNDDVTKNEEIKKSNIYEVFHRLNEMVKQSDKAKSNH